MTIGKNCRLTRITRYKKNKDGTPIKGRWLPGQSGNPLGRVAKPEIAELRKALAIVKKEKNLSFLEEFVRKAYDHKDYAVALFKKIIPSEAFISKEDQRIVVNFKGKLGEEPIVVDAED